MKAVAKPFCAQKCVQPLLSGSGLCSFVFVSAVSANMLCMPLYAMHSSTGTTLYHPAHMYMIDHDCTCTFVTVDRNISKLVKSPEHDRTRTASYGSSS